MIQKIMGKFTYYSANPLHYVGMRHARRTTATASPTVITSRYIGISCIPHFVAHVCTYRMQMQESIGTTLSRCICIELEGCRYFAYCAIQCGVLLYVWLPPPACIFYLFCISGAIDDKLCYMIVARAIFLTSMLISFNSCGAN